MVAQLWRDVGKACAKAAGSSIGHLIRADLYACRIEGQ